MPSNVQEREREDISKCKRINTNKYQIQFFFSFYVISEAPHKKKKVEILKLSKR